MGSEAADRQLREGEARVLLIAHLHWGLGRTCGRGRAVLLNRDRLGLCGPGSKGQWSPYGDEKITPTRVSHLELGLEQGIGEGREGRKRRREKLICIKR